MATTKKSTNAKTKTAKKTITKSTPVVKKSVTVTPSKPVKLAQKLSITAPRLKNSLIQLQLIMAVLALGLAAMAAWYMNHQSYQVVTGLLTSNELASKATTVFVPAVRSLFDVEIKWAVVTIMVLSAILPLLYITRLKKWYQTGLQRRVFLWRWIDMAVVGALIVELLALLTGVQDLMTLKLMGASVAISGVLAWLAERQHAETERPATVAYVLSIVVGLLPWLLIGVYALATPLYGMVRNTGFVYVLYVTTLLGFVATALNLGKHLRGGKKALSYETTERNYWLINIFVRTAFAIALITGLIKQ